MKFLTIKMKTILVIFAIILCFAIAIPFSITSISSMPKAEFTIVIDAGHGGVDVKLGQ